MRQRSACLLIVMLAVLAGTGLAEDWPMLAHDVRRTGATSDEVAAPVDFAWLRYFHLEGVMRSVQPVVAGGRLYLPTLKGKVYCLNAKTGEDIWVAQLPAGVIHTPCITPEGLFVTTALDGKIYALKTSDGSEAWRVKTRAALWSSPLPHAGKVYVTGRDGLLYCIDAASGKVAWTYRAKGPIAQSPALDAERARIYFCDEAMYTHAVDAETGEGVWVSEQLQGVTACVFYPVIAPDGTVLVSTVPIYAHVPGPPFGRAQLPLRKAMETLLGTEELGEEFTKYPGEYIRTPQNWRLTEAGKERFQAVIDEVMLAPDYPEKLFGLTREAMKNDPATQRLFLLDPKTGKQRGIPPVLYESFCKSPPFPPVVTNDGKVITRTATYLPSTLRAYQAMTNVVYLDTATGDLTPVFDESRFNSGLGLRLIADEACQLAVSGKWLLNINTGRGEFISAFDLSDPQKRTFVNYTQGPVHWCGTGLMENLLRGDYGKIPWGQERLLAEFAAGGYAGGTENQCPNQPPVVVDDMMYFVLAAGELIALKTTDNPPPKPEKSRDYEAFGIKPMTDAEMDELLATWPVDFDAIHLDRQREGGQPMAWPANFHFPMGTAQNPDEQAAKAADDIPDAALDEIIWSKPTSPSDDQTPMAMEIRKQLAAAVEEYISEPLWMPYRFQAGKAAPVALQFFNDPTDGLLAMALAYPHLDADLQARVKDYVRAEWFRSNPLMMNAAYTYGEGTPREAYLVPDDGVASRVLAPLVRPRGLRRLYAAWLFAQATGQWDMLKPLVGQLKGYASQQPVFKDKGFSDADDSANSFVAGLIAACRIAKHFKATDALEALLPATRKALRDRIAYALRYSRGKIVNGQKYDWPRYCRWLWLTPEVGRAIQTHAPSSVALLGKHLDWRQPFWFLQWGIVTPYAGEQSMQIPRNTMAGFLGQAYLKDAPPEQLRIYADIKACKADPFWIQKLAIVLNAMEQ